MAAAAEAEVVMQEGEEGVGGPMLVSGACFWALEKARRFWPIPQEEADSDWSGRRGDALKCTRAFAP